MKRPNIVFIFCDDLGYGDIGCYGSPCNRTPRLDQMAQEGMRFTDFYVPSPICSPSRAGLMTGCYPKRVGLDGGENFPVLLPGDSIGLNPNETTVAELLRSSGYRTKLIGKWHLGDQETFSPLNHGFDHYFGLPYSNDMLPDHPKNVDFKFPPLPLVRDKEVIECDPNQASLTNRYIAEAQRFIEECAEKDEPFFLYLSHMYVHTPIYAPHKYLAASQNGSYGAAVEHVDDATGMLIETLKANGIDEDTLVVFTSDNGSNGRGGGSNLPLRGTKFTTWEGGMREPCICRWPGTIPAGAESNEVITSMDFLPTFATLAGTEPPRGNTIDGHDITSLLKGDPDAASPYEAFYYYGPGDHKLHAVRSGKWKYHLIRDELYNLEEDIGESENLRETYPEVVEKLRKMADECRNDLGDAHTDTPGANCREVGQVDAPKYMISLDELDPYLQALYD